MKVIPKPLNVKWIDMPLKSIKKLMLFKIILIR